MRPNAFPSFQKDILMTKKTTLLAGAAALLLASAPALALAAGNLVANGDFETGDFTGWTEFGDDTIYKGVTCAGADPAGGDCLAYFGTATPSGITQSIDLGQAGQAYAVSFAFMPDGGLPSSLKVEFGGQTLLSLNNSSASDFQVFSFNGLSNAARMTLSFTFTDPSGLLFLDNVSVTAVPEPATLGLMGAGLAALAFIGRRRGAGQRAAAV